MWNFEYGGIGGIWSGVGEMEALCDLIFDNLASRRVRHVIVYMMRYSGIAADSLYTTSSS